MFLAHLSRMINFVMCNVRCTAAQLIPVIHCVQEGIDDREKVTVDIIKTAYSRMGDEYTVPYSKIGIEGTNGSLIVRNGYRSGGRDSRERVNDFCYINDISTEVNDIAVESDHPLNNAEIQRAISIPENVLQRLIAYLKEQNKKNKNKKESKKRRASDPRASMGDGIQSNNCRKRGGSVTSTGTDITQDDVTDPKAAAICYH